MMCGSEKWFRIAGLLARQRVGQLSEKELRELEEWREASSENKLLYDRWQDGEFLEASFKSYQRIGRRKALLDMEKRVQFQRKKKLRLRVLRWGSVAAVFVMVVLSSLYLFDRETEKTVKEQVAIALMKPQRPVLRLDNGTTNQFYILIISLSIVYKQIQNAHVFLKRMIHYWVLLAHHLFSQSYGIFPNYSIENA